MFRNLLVLIFIFMSACILYVEPSEQWNSSGEYESYTDVWISGAYLECGYDYLHYPGGSVWYAEIYVGSAYDYDSIDMDVNISYEFHSGWGNWIWAHYEGGGIWSSAFALDSSDCYDYYIFDFLAEDIYGSAAEYRIYW